MNHDSTDSRARRQHGLDLEQALADLDQSIAEREQARADRDQERLDTSQQTLDADAADRRHGRPRPSSGSPSRNRARAS
jgi:hypothetical protein